MSGVMRRHLLLSLAALALAATTARAGSADLKREIQAQQSAANDLAALDPGHMVADEIALLKTWLDEAWDRQTKDQGARAREALDRCLAQGDLIRQKITTGKMLAQAAEHEKAAADAKDKLAATKKALDEANVKKKAMEMNAK
jgi:hypothetical protein